MHGRGWILRVARLVTGSAAVRFDIGRETWIEGPLSDWIVVWAFMRAHERDAPFQQSLAIVRPGAVAIDVGANVGIWSLLAARRGATVHAFEPVPALAARLRRHTADNRLDSIVVNEVALGAERKRTPFFAIPDGNTGASSLARHRDDSVQIDVDVIPLDDSIDRADILKVDVEGAEIFVFRGARRLLSMESAPVVFFEVNELLCQRFGVRGADVKRLLADCGYAIYRWRRGAFEPVSIEERHSHEDLFALKPSHMTRIQES